MDTIRIIYTRRQNPASWAIRWAVPRSRFALARSSHCLVADGGHVIEAHMLHGVRRVLEGEGLAGLIVVKAVEYEVPDAEAGLAWARSQVEARYDWEGAFGLALAEGRDWQDPARWFCFELAAATLMNAGRNAFSDVGHITGEHLMMLRPEMA